VTGHGDPGDRTLCALGLAEAPREQPLSCPGARPEESGPLAGDRLLSPDRLVHEGRVPGLAAGSHACHVSAPPFGPGAVRELFVPRPVRVASDYGSTLPGAYACVNRRGVPHGGTGSPRRHPSRQRRLFHRAPDGAPPAAGAVRVTPEESGTRARADRALGALVTRPFAEEKPVTASGPERFLRPQQTGSPGTGASLSPPWM
jgi:hypothetical protein